MTDAMRAMTAVPGFLDAADLHLVETSPVLAAEQQKRLDASWHETLDQVPEGPMLLVANEFFDALPIRQFEMTTREGGKSWCERCVSVQGGELAFATGAQAENLKAQGAPGDIFETSPASIAVMEEIAGRMRDDKGSALIIDYGHVAPGLGDTLQAIRDHQYADVLEQPGGADLTAHVDFAALEEAAVKAGAIVHGPLTQGRFLKALGIEERAQKLAKVANPGQRSEMATALKRLTDAAAMGDLFKVMAVTDPNAPQPAGFE